ncbi:hypothetical protein CYMTET_51954 [Cymbomonas tetramitiformis]|uniref:Uncharacterized protein n=1 Tax=Cymbomonas tetramitiformis TaxID=36881 RepID=A0AAE0BJY4_9CHLO|nr:hypothetical protein CYMTET_51954 [Cymbomonas tetramitiformis]
MLCNRWTKLELRGQLEQEPGSSQGGGADALRAKLQFVEDRVYHAADGVVADEVLQRWLNDFDKNRRKTVLSATSKSAANADTRVAKDHRDQRWEERKKYNDEKDSKKPAGKGGEAAEGIMTRGGRQFRDADAEDIDRGGDSKENKRGGAVENFLTRSLCEW